MVQFARPGWRRAAAAAGATTALATALVVVVPVAPAAAGHGHGSGGPQVIADGLNSPRHLTVARDGLYVAESGTGGSGPCIEGAEGPACYGATGSITRVSHGRQQRVVSGLPSVAGAGGAAATGPADVEVHGRTYTVALGLGADPAERAKLPGLGRKLATVSTGRFGRAGLQVVADVGRYEARRNPDGKQIDTNPVGLLGHGWRDYVVDAGGNSLLRYDARGRIRTAAVFPTTVVPTPPIPGVPPTVDMDAVPTAAAYGPDGAIYVSQLTGFPFPVGGASIWRVLPGRTPTTYATGLTTVTDLAFGRDGSLYAVQLADQGLLAGPDAKGSVVRIPRGGGADHSTVIGGLSSPYGIAVAGRTAYVTTCSVCPGGGEVLRVPLR